MTLYFSNSKKSDFSSGMEKSESEALFERIKMDFGVDLLASEKKSSLFCGLQKEGQESPIKGTWHFGVCNQRVWMRSGNSPQYGWSYAYQWYIPRYELAEAIAGAQLHSHQSEDELSSLLKYDDLKTFCDDGNGDFFLVEFDDKSLGFRNGPTRYQISDEWLAVLTQDIPLLQEAKKKVCQRDKEFYLPDTKTSAGHPVQSPSRALIEAIAFEELITGTLDSKQFGIFAAYCTSRDFKDTVEMPDSIIRELIEGQFQYTPDEIDDQMMDLFMTTQQRVFARPIWGEGIEMDIEEAIPIVSEGMKKLSRTKRVQFILMNGMHGAGLFLPLAVLADVIRFQSYGFFLCQSYQPDSEEEQILRKQSAYIKLYGELVEQHN